MKCPRRRKRGARLVGTGAAVDARDGVKRCARAAHGSPAREREIAEALLDCGAGIEMRDRLGDTPLRRAVNCNQPDVAALLLARGADIHSVGSKGLTPLSDTHRRDAPAASIAAVAPAFFVRRVITPRTP